MEIERFLISILVVNIKGQLGKIASFFGDNNVNIFKLAVSSADKDGKIQRIIACIEGKREDIALVCEKLKNFDDNTLKIDTFTEKDQYIDRELSLIKISADDPSAAKVMNLITLNEGKVIFNNQEIIVFLVEAPEENMNRIINKLIEITKNIEVFRSGMTISDLSNNINNIIISGL